jgi:hypothetical protein
MPSNADFDRIPAPISTHDFPTSSYGIHIYVYSKDRLDFAGEAI